ncbi:hypothetical protein PCASD_15916 [Puccinia coronata f. sp. avenae]|uniref:Uncharacterized protein n=1 Tax=Puccinia coronata f. sp. avenae TaxID=200324 RepID=A0A2N5UEX9_9BASI|nr:hypothetical protein PCASD_15916 [Puccinia coronata f. sp. avenae]
MSQPGGAIQAKPSHYIKPRLPPSTTSSLKNPCSALQNNLNCLLKENTGLNDLPGGLASPMCRSFYCQWPGSPAIKPQTPQWLGSPAIGQHTSMAWQPSHQATNLDGRVAQPLSHKPRWPGSSAIEPQISMAGEPSHQDTHLDGREAQPSRHTA